MSSDSQSEIDIDRTALSRREFLGGAGVAAGTAVALGSALGVGAIPTAQAALASDAFNVVAMWLLIDGAFAGSVVNASGGDPSIELPDGQGTLGSTAVPGLRYNSLELTLGDDATPSLLDWIQQATLARAPLAGRSAGLVTFNPYTSQVLHTLKLNGVRLTEVTFPGGNATADQPARLGLKLQVESSSHQTDGGTASASSLKSKRMMLANFRFSIAGLEAESALVSKVEPVTVALRGDGLWAAKPLRFELSTLQAAPMYKWLAETLRGRTGERSGVLRMMNATMKDVLSAVEFPSLGISRVALRGPIPGISSDRVSVEAYCRGLKFNFDGLKA